MSKYPHEQPMDEQDAAILASVADLFEALDPPPPSLDDSVLLALSLSDMDAELATLFQAGAPVLRAVEAEAIKTVTFTSSAMQLMVSVSEESPGSLRVDGWVTGGGVDVALYQGNKPRWTVSDPNGRVAWREVPHGRIRFLIQPMAPGSKPVLTPVVEF